MPIDMSLAAKAPPARSSSGVKNVASKKMTTEDKRTQAVNGIFQLAQIGTVMAGQHADAAAIGMHGEGIAQEVVELAKINDNIGKAVDYLTEVGPYAGLVTAVLPLALQLLANHKRIPADKIPGVTDPEVLAANMQAAMAKQAAQEMQAAQAEQEEAERIMADVAARQAPQRARSDGEAPANAA